MRLRSATFVALVCASLLCAACTTSKTAHSPRTSTTIAPTSSSSRSTPRSAAAARLVIARASWRIPSPLSREVALGYGGGILVIGGLSAAGTSSTTVLFVDPRSGAVRVWGRLTQATHDAAGAVLHGTPFVFGGGSASSTATVQRLRAGSTASFAGALPRRRSDLAAATVGDAALLVGGYDDTSWDPSVLHTPDGTTFDRVSSLPVPVRYAAVASTGDAVWTFGGRTVSGTTRAIQRIDARTGRADAAGQLPYAVSDAVAVRLGQDIYICGGLVGGRQSDRVLSFDPGTGATRGVARLPYAVSDTAAVVVGDTAYLVGGETPDQSSSVTTLRLAGGGA